MIVAAVHRRARDALQAGPNDADPRVDSLREFLVRECPFGCARTAAYLGFGIATALDQLQRGEGEAAQRTLLLLLTALEQSCIDKGKWNLAWLLTHLPEPPWHHLAQSPPADALRPFGKLAHPSWIAAAWPT